MKSYLKASALALLAALLLTTVSAMTARAATREFHLRGTLETVETHTGSFPVFGMELSGVGQASLLGRFGLTMNGTVNLLTRSGSGTARFRAANGDTIFTNGVGHATLTGPNEASIVEIFTITGGTGRFAGATGSIRMERVVDTLALVSSGTLEGVIILPSPSLGSSQSH